MMAKSCRSFISRPAKFLITATGGNAGRVHHLHGSSIVRLPTGQHMVADGHELKAEHEKHMREGNKDWNEKLATHSEAGVRAEKDTRDPATLQRETIKRADHAGGGRDTHH